MTSNVMAEASRWHPDEQEFLAKLEQQCNTYYEHHNADHMYYQKLATRFNIPILIVSAVNALTAVGLNSFIAQEYVSVLNAILSAGTGVLGSIQLYLKISEKMTNSLRAAILMKRLALKISKELSIDMANRVTKGEAFLGDCFAEFNTALEQGNPIEKSLHNHLAFTPAIKKERYSLVNAAVNLVSRSPRSEANEFSSNERMIRLEGSRAKKLWGLADRARTGGYSPPEYRTPPDPSESSQEDIGQRERDVETGALGS